MEMYILDSLLRRTEVVDKFESLIWTERFSAFGDFELVIKSTRESRSQFLTGTKVAINSSYRVMVVDTVEDDIDGDGKATLNVKGYSLEAMLQDRVAKDTLSNLSVEPSWVLTGLPANIARTMFDDICRTGNLSPQDIIPFITPGTIFAASTIPEPSTAITWKQEPDSLYNAIKSVSDLYDLGFRLVRNFDTSQLYFDVYSGSDRTTRQTIFPPVIFAPNFDNLQNTKELTTIRNTKNVAYVFSEAGFAVVYPDDVDPDVVDGFDRHVLMVNAMEVTSSTGDISGALQQAGKEALLANRSLSVFDGELAVDYHVQETPRVNMLEQRNPEFLRDDFSAWYTLPRITNPNNCVLTWKPPSFMRMTTLTAGFMYAGIINSPVIPGVQYTWSYSVKSELDSQKLTTFPVFNFYASDGTTLLGQYYPEDWHVPTVPGDYVRMWQTSVAPPGAAFVDCFIASDDAIAGASYVIKEIQLALGTTTVFVPQRTPKARPYRYGYDYDLGDIVELRNIDGVITNRRVSEQIFVCDSEGERSYPTLMANDFIMAGTWLTAPIDQVWADFTAEHWADM